MHTDTPRLSVIVPVCNEAENIWPLVVEIDHALRGHWSFEIIFIDDASDDETPIKLIEAEKIGGHFRHFRHRTRCGQSQAVASGIKLAKGEIIATLDGDGQNDPADIPALVTRLLLLPEEQHDFWLIAGFRQKRQDNPLRRLSSYIANLVRAFLLGDDTPDSGCGLKVLTRAAFLDLPRFNHMHRFLPALMIRRGAKVVSLRVNHRPRQKGLSKYGLWNRLWVGIVDILGVIWLQKRASLPEIVLPDNDGTVL